MNINDTASHFKQLCQHIINLNVISYKTLFKRIWNDDNFGKLRFMRNNDGNPLLFCLLECDDIKDNIDLIKHILKITFDNVKHRKFLAIPWTKNNKNQTLFQAAIIDKHNALFRAIIDVVGDLEFEQLLTTKINVDDKYFNDYPLNILIKKNRLKQIKRLSAICIQDGIYSKILSLGQLNPIHATIKYQKPDILRHFLKFPHV